MPMANGCVSLIKIQQLQIKQKPYSFVRLCFFTRKVEQQANFWSKSPCWGAKAQKICKMIWICNSDLELLMKIKVK